LLTAAALPAAVAPTRAAAAGSISVADLLPFSLSGETYQNSEQNIGVNPANPQQAVVSTFSTSPGGAYFATGDGGTSFINFDNKTSFDSSLAYSASGTAYLARISAIATNQRSGTVTISKSTNPTGNVPFTDINNYTTPANTQIPDQPWVEAAQVGGQDHIYVCLNDLSQSSGNTATIRYSLDGGTTFTNSVIEHGSPAGGQDDPSVRVAINGSRVYAAFCRYNSVGANTNGGYTIGSTIAVVRDDNNGSSGFAALGTLGTTVASPNVVFTTTDSSSKSLGNERVAANLTLAVDPNNANKVFVSYVDQPASGQLQVHVWRSTNSGTSFTDVFDSPIASKAALPALAVDGSGDVGLLYTSLESSRLVTHLVTSANDLVSGNTDNVLASFPDGTPTRTFDPYIGDYEELSAVGNTFYGSFSASNQADGTNLIFGPNVTPKFLRNFAGTIGTASFQLRSISNTAVAASIDPYYFSDTVRASNLTWNNTGASSPSDGMAWDINGNLNWNNGVIPVVYHDGDNVTFNDVNNAHYAVTLNTVISPGTVTVSNSAGSYTISGTGGIAGAAALTKSGTGVLTISTVNTYSGSTTVNAGTLTLAAGGSLASGTVTVASGATMNVNGSLSSTATVNAQGTVSFHGNAGTTPSTQQLSALTVGSGVTVTVSLSSASLTPQTLAPTTLTFTGATSRLDLTNNILIANGSVSDAEALVTPADPNHHVITNTVSSVRPLVLGYKDAGSGKYEIRATLLGDTDLDGQVNVGDLANLAGNFGATSGAFWANGDFDYNGTVNIADLSDLAGNFGDGLPGAGVGNATATAATAGAAVPEPSSIALLTLATSTLVPHRRRRRTR
jgi:autotransporter-associated beta strand protein